jgi:EAL domain-containing protein (putative c-di-GMP-specific phosphodiesterase class I)
MRTWEIEDTSKLLPSDLVREQDFILRVRRLQRLGTPHLVINLVLSAIDAFSKSQGALEAVQQQLQEFAKVSNGVYAEMSNGDVFIIWEETAGAQAFPARIVSAIMPDAPTSVDTSRFLLIWHTPKDYTPLRERTNHYVEVAQAVSSLGTGGSPAQVLKSEAARGELTAWSVDQIGKLLGEIDLRRYARTQTIYRREANNLWQPVSEEYFISFEDLRRERFPKLDLITPEHLFLALCEMLDQRLLVMLTERPETISGRPIRLNLSVRSIVGSTFAQFIHGMSHDKRGLIGFELHRGDLFQDFTLTLAAIGVLRSEGFKVAIDSVTPDMLDYLNLSSFDVDQIKINVSKDRAAQLDDPKIRKNLSQLPTNKLIFFRCDNERALAAGIALGVTQFQGWLIDDAAQTKTGG